MTATRRTGGRSGSWRRLGSDGHYEGAPWREPVSRHPVYNRPDPDVPTPADGRLLLTTDEAAGWLGLSYGAVLAWIRGECWGGARLRASRRSNTYYIDLDDLRAFVAAHRTEG